MDSRHLALFSLACLLSAIPTAVHAHGFMFEPAARNVIHNSNYCPHCLSSGGAYEVSAHSTLTWPAGIRSVCGSSDHDVGGIYGPTAPVKTYTSGSAISISILLQSNHGGRHMFRLCDRTNADEACLAAHVLQRTDGTGPYTWVPTEPVGGPAFPASGYGTGSLLDQSGEIYIFDYKLPDGVACAACTLQWWWTTSNSCDIPGNPLGGGGMEPCDSPGPYPEEFFNCADIAITGGATGQATVPTQQTTTLTPAATASDTASTASTGIAATPAPVVMTPTPDTATSTPTPTPTSDDSSTAVATSAANSEASTTYSRKMVPGGSAGCDANCACQAIIDGVTAAPWNCAEFVLCAGGSGQSQACDSGLLWDIAANACNFAAVVDCGGRPRF